MGAASIFTARYQAEPVVVHSPGRINLIGEHTDYNEGFVLPAAISLGVTVAAATFDGTIRLYSVQYDQEFTIIPQAIRPTPGLWSSYIIGIYDQLVNRSYPVGGFSMVIDGNVPPGAGLSSSAALGCAVCAALGDLFELQLDSTEMIQITQAAEHAFAGVHCGVMDMFASINGKKDHALLLDCRSLTYKEIPLRLDGYRLVLFNSHVKHQLADTAYNRRREECIEGVSIIQRHIPKVRSLRDVTTDMLIEYVNDPLVHRRCRFVIEENERVHRAVKCLRANDIRGLGQQLWLSHEGLTHDYEVSCPELDWLVASVRHRSYVLGARMMGGGFGGCTINLVKEQYVEKLIDELTEKYERFIGLTLSAYVVQTARGTHLITQKQTA